MPKAKDPTRINQLNSLDAATIEKVRTQSREAAARHRIEQQNQERKWLTFNHNLSGEILPNCDSVPLEDLAARWKVSPAMLVEAAGNGLFDIVITEREGLRDYWYFNRSRWPHGEQTTVVPRAGIVHTVISPPLRFSPIPQYYFPLEEVTRIEQGSAHCSLGIDSSGGQWGTVKEAANHYSCCERTIRNKIKANTTAFAFKRTPAGIRVKLS